MRMISVEASMSSVFYLWKADVSIDEIAEKCEIHRSTVYRWIMKFRLFGLKRTIERYALSKRKQRNQLPKSTKELIVKVRKLHKDCCGQKVKHYLEKDYDTKVSLATIYRVLGKNKLLRKTRKTKLYSKENKRTKVEWERQLIETDTVDFGELYAFTFIDVFTRQASVVLKTILNSRSGREALEDSMKKYKRSDIIQSDGGPEFKKEFRSAVKQFCFKYRQSRPFRKNDQAHIESFNRSLRQECLGHKYYKKEEIAEVNEKVEQYLNYYNNERAHLGLNFKSPNQVAFCRI